MDGLTSNGWFRVHTSNRGSGSRWQLTSGILLHDRLAEGVSHISDVVESCHIFIGGNWKTRKLDAGLLFNDIRNTVNFFLAQRLYLPAHSK